MTDWSVNKIVFFRKEKKVQNVLKQKNMQKYFAMESVKNIFPDSFIKIKVFFLEPNFFFFKKTYVLDHFGSFHMHIEEL